MTGWDDGTRIALARLQRQRERDAADRTRLQAARDRDALREAERAAAPCAVLGFLDIPHMWFALGPYDGCAACGVTRPTANTEGARPAERPDAPQSAPR